MPVRRRRLAVATLVPMVALALGGCGSSGSSDSAGPPGTLSVVATTNVYGSLAEAVGGPHVTVRSLISSPTADPHEYESTPADAVAVGKATVLIENGGGYDEFAGKLVAASGSHPVVLDAVQLSDLPASPDRNEHVWYRLPTMAALADALAAELGRADPAHAADYRARAGAFNAELTRLSGKLAAIKATHSGARVAVTEPVPLYLTEQAGLRNATPEAFSHAIEEGTDPPAAVLGQTLELVTGPDKVSALLVNTQTESAATNQLRQAAEASRVPVVPVSETLPGGTDYPRWIDGTIEALAAALGDHR